VEFTRLRLTLGKILRGRFCPRASQPSPEPSIPWILTRGIFGQSSGAPLQLNVQLIGNGTLLDLTVTPSQAGTFNPAAVTFQHYHFTFIANSAITTIQFTDVGFGNGTADTLIDSVAVVQNSSRECEFRNWTLCIAWHGLELDCRWQPKRCGTCEGATSPTHSAALNAGSDSQGNTLSQIVATNNGQIYAIDFDSGIFGQPQRKRLAVECAGNRQRNSARSNYHSGGLPHVRPKRGGLRSFPLHFHRQ